MEVSEKVKKQYHENSIHKNLLIEIPELEMTVSNEQICYETMKLRESILKSDNIEFVGCIASVFQIQLENLLEDVKGKRIRVSISTEDTQDEPVALFNGIIDSAKMQSNRKKKEIVAYDELYTKGNTEVSAWYKSLAFPVTLKDLRDSLFAYIGLGQAEASLPNDGISIKKQYAPNSLQALSVIKAVCQINGVFGIINRQGIFEYRILGNIEEDEGIYPSETLFPGDDVFPADPGAYAGAGSRSGMEATGFSFYRSVSYEEFEVKPVDKLTVRQSEEDEGVACGTGTNNYIIQGNMFTYGLPKDTLVTIAENIYPNVQGFAYHPFTAENNGLPFLECGLDAVSYIMVDWENSTGGEIVYEEKSFYILNRELTGTQALKDSYSAQGEEYQTEFITDLQIQIDILKKNGGANVQTQIEDYTYSKSEIDGMFSGGGGDGGIANIVLVDRLPPDADSNTLYVVKGEVVVD